MVSILTMSICLSFVSCTFAYCTHMIHLGKTPHLFPYTVHLWGGWMELQYLHVLFGFYYFSGCMLSTCSFPSDLLLAAVCVLLTHTCLGHIRTWLLVTMFASFIPLSSLLISITMLSSLIPWIYWSFTHLLSPWWLQSFAAIQSLFIHPSAFSLLWLFNLQSRRDMTVSLNWCSSFN